MTHAVPEASTRPEEWILGRVIEFRRRASAVFQRQADDALRMHRLAFFH